MEFSETSVEYGLRLLDLNVTPEEVHEHITTVQEAFENELLKDDKVCGETSNSLIAARSSILLQSIQNCTGLGQDVVYPTLKLKTKCKLCNGVGAVPMMEVVYIPNSEKCSACNGTGIKTEHCTACNGTGKKGRDICGLCKGKGIYVFRKNKSRKAAIKCPTCQGSKYVGSYKTTGKIVSATICSVCKGLGQLRK